MAQSTRPAEKHEARITPQIAARHRDPMRYRVDCPTCGRVGVDFDVRADAEVVAQRHAEVGGFG